MSRPWVLAECTWKDIRERVIEVAVLPWGATEPHNTHLPYATDNIQSEHIAAEAAREAGDPRIIVLPAVPFGVNTGQLDLALTINLNPSTQFAVLRDVASALSGQGVRKLVLLNGHGGNDFRQMIRELSPLLPIFVTQVNWWGLGTPRELFVEPGDHAGELETSVMQHVAPALVRPLAEAGPGRARVFRIRALREGWAWAPRHWRSVTDDTGTGDPAHATREKGAAYVQQVVSALSEFLRELADADLRDLYTDADRQSPA